LSGYLTSTTAVTTLSGGTTGLTPSTATSGAIVLAGTLSAANGGTGVTTVAAEQTRLGLGSNAYTSTSYQPLAINLTSFGGLTNASGVLINNGSGTFSYSNAPTLTGTNFTGIPYTSLTGAPSLSGYLTSTTAVTTLSGGTTGLTPSTATSGAIVLAGTLSLANGGTGSNTQNFVDLTTAQTIAGAKTWSGLGTLNAGITVTGGTINLNADATSNGVNIGTSLNTGTIALGGTGTQTINIGNDATATKTINIGSTNSTTGITQKVGTGNFSLDGASSSTYSIGASTTTGTITIGGSAQTGLTNIANGTGSQTINIANGGTGDKVINIGAGASGTSEITIGNAGTTSGNGIRIGNGRFSINKTSTTPNTYFSATNNITLADVVDRGIIVANRSSNGITLTLPTAQGNSGIVQAFPGTPAVGDVIALLIVNSNNQIATLATASGITLTGTPTIASNSSRMFYFRITSIVSGSETITVY
jgi:hypothetical protein